MDTVYLQTIAYRIFSAIRDQCETRVVTPSTFIHKLKTGEAIHEATVSLSNSNLCILHLQNMAEIHTSPALMVCTSICKPSLNYALKSLLYRCLGMLNILSFSKV